MAEQDEGIDFELDPANLSTDELGEHCKELFRWLSLTRAKGDRPSSIQWRQVEETLREAGRWIIDSNESLR